jgi:cytochrome c oxidase subunit 2
MPKFDLRLSRLTSLVLAGLLIGLVLACTPSHPQSTFDTLGPVARSQLNLFWIIFWIGLVIFIGVEGAVVYLAIRYRHRRGQDGDPPQIHGNNRLEIAWTIAPALILFVIAVPSTITIFDNLVSPHPPEEGGLLVEATGHQWWFEFEYPGQNVVTANDMWIPTGEVVNVHLSSDDVIHSFWVPKLAGKLDMVPGNDNKMWLWADQPGVFYGQCAEFCGVSHANMRFRVIAVPRAQFDLWAQGAASDGLVPVDPLAQEGGALFIGSAGCSACHTVQGNSRARGRVGPNLTHVASRTTIAAGLLHNTDESGNVNSTFLQQNLREWITDPDAVKPGNIMSRDGIVYNGDAPPLTESQVSALVAYLMTLK